MHLKLEPLPTINKNASRLADFIMFAQHSFLLDLSRELSDERVSFSQFFLLGFLARGHCPTMQEVSAKVGRSGAASTALVGRLEKLGYVQRIHAADDRRVVRVQINASGQELVRRMKADIEVNLVDMMGGDMDVPEQALRLVN